MTAFFFSLSLCAALPKVRMNFPAQSLEYPSIGSLPPTIITQNFHSNHTSIYQHGAKTVSLTRQNYFRTTTHMAIVLVSFPRSRFLYTSTGSLLQATIRIGQARLPCILSLHDFSLHFHVACHSLSFSAVAYSTFAFEESGSAWHGRRRDHGSCKNEKLSDG